MKNRFIILFLLISFTGIAGPGDTSWVNVHQNTQMTWYERYRASAQMPDHQKSYHQILMYYRLGCANNGCSDWDYTTRVSLLHPTGLLDSNISSIDTIGTNPLVIDTIWQTFEVVEPYELARVITPYGGSLPGSWSHRFVYDLTDYYSLLRDSVEIEVFYQGYSSGFSADIDFAFIEGPRPREVLKIDNIYMGSGSYYNSNDFEGNHLPSRSVDIDPLTQGLELKVNFSGHGFVNALNCAEFCEKDYYLKVGGQQVASQAIWRDDCGLNPIWPQAGTWLYDRANWCPGDKSLFRHHDLSPYLSGSGLDIDIDIEPYSYVVPPGETPAGYNYSVQLIQYADFNQQHDVALSRIISPSDDDEYGRLNPVCGHAKVRLQNRGGQVLTSCQIDYGIQGQAWQSYSWSGNLAPMEYTDVTLPFGLDERDWYLPAGGSLKFGARTSLPNAETDQNPWNDYHTTDFMATPTYPGKFKLYLKTNAAASETHWTLKSIDDSLIASGDNLLNNQVYNYNFDLAPGCYRLSIKDRDKDGLAFFGNSDGSGIIRLIGEGGSNFFKNLEANFGTELSQEFTVGYSIGGEELIGGSPKFDVFPNPARDIVHISWQEGLRGPLQVRLTDLSGKVILSQQVDSTEEFSVDVSLAGTAAGTYLLLIETAKDQHHQKISIY